MLHLYLYPYPIKRDAHQSDSLMLASVRAFLEEPGITCDIKREMAGDGELLINRNERGKPRLFVNGKKAPLFLSFSHADTLCVCAVSLAPIGVDIERVRPLPAEKLLCRFFAKSELSALSSFKEEERPAQFIRLWVRKEAAFKCIGDHALFPLLSQTDVRQDFIAFGEKTGVLTDIKGCPEGFLCAVCQKEKEIPILHGLSREPCY